MTRSYFNEKFVLITIAKIRILFEFMDDLSDRKMKENGHTFSDSRCHMRLSPL